MNTSVGSKPIFDIKVTEENTKITTPMLYVSGKNFLSFGSLAAIASQKSSSGGLSAYSSTRGSGVQNFRLSTGGSEFETLSKVKTEHVSGD